MTLRTAITSVLGVVFAAVGIAAALGVASLPKDWSRVGSLISLVLIWILWGPLMRVRARAYGATPPEIGASINRNAIAIAALVGLAVIAAISLGWVEM